MKIEMNEIEIIEIDMNEMYKKHFASVKNHIGYRVSNRFDIEDITQLVFIKANRLLSTYKIEISAFSTWLHNITNSVIIDWHRTNHRDKYPLMSSFIDDDGNETFDATSPMSTDAGLEAQDLNKRLLKAFRGLKPNYRKIAVMYFIREMEHLEIADKLNVPLGTVKGMISRCRGMLKTQLNDIYKVKERKEVA